jgi:hypothetical protein
MFSFSLHLLPEGQQEPHLAPCSLGAQGSQVWDLGRWQGRSRAGAGHTRVVLILPDLQLHQILALTQDLHSVLHGTVVQADVVNGQEFVAWLEGTSPA